MLYVILLLLYVGFVMLGYGVTWMQLRSRGLSLTAMEYLSPFIKKNIFEYPHNKSVFDALEIIRDNNLELSFRDLEKMHQSNVDFQNVVRAFLLVKTRNIGISPEDLKEWAYSSKNLWEEINARKAGEEIQFADFLGKKRAITPEGRQRVMT